MYFNVENNFQQYFVGVKHGIFKFYLHWTLSNLSSLSVVCGMGKLSALQVNSFPLSSIPGTNVIVEIVALPSSFTESRTLVLKRSAPSHQLIWAAGREPIVWHWNSALLPAESTSRGVSEEAPFVDEVLPLRELRLVEPRFNIFTSNGRTKDKEKYKHNINK